MCPIFSYLWLNIFARYKAWISSHDIKPKFKCPLMTQVWALRIFIRPFVPVRFFPLFEKCLSCALKIITHTTEACITMAGTKQGQGNWRRKCELGLNLRRDGLESGHFMKQQNRTDSYKKKRPTVFSDVGNAQYKRPGRVSENIIHIVHYNFHQSIFVLCDCFREPLNTTENRLPVKSCQRMILFEARCRNRHSYISRQPIRTFLINCPENNFKKRRITGTVRSWVYNVRKWMDGVVHKRQSTFLQSEMCERHKVCTRRLSPVSLSISCG